MPNLLGFGSACSLQVPGHPVQYSWGQSRSAVARGLFLFILALLEQPLQVGFKGLLNIFNLTSSLHLHLRLFNAVALRQRMLLIFCFHPGSEPVGLLADVASHETFVVSYPLSLLCWIASWEEPVAADMTPPGPLTGSERYYKITTSRLWEHRFQNFIIK